MNDLAWQRLVAGVDCPFDAPRPESSEHWDLIAPLSTSSLYLAMNQTYRGQCVLILDRHAVRPDQLTTDEWLGFCRDLYTAQKTVVTVARPDHVNVASLGNVLPHMHWHIIPRFRDDPRWGAPIWTSQLEDMPETRLEPDDRAALIESLRSALVAVNGRTW
jgi:diadenosine tetraphosphate (Ap4A) HIT family hydrolase